MPHGQAQGREIRLQLARGPRQRHLLPGPHQGSLPKPRQEAPWTQRQGLLARGPPMKILALANNKGGVGKTTAATNLAAQAVRSKLGATILVDLDPQRNAGFGLGVAMDMAGMDEFLGGRVELTEIIHPHAVDSQRLPAGADPEDFVIEGLYIVAGGPYLQDESDRLSEVDFEKAVDRLRAGLIAFDDAAAAQGVPVGLVVLDLPPNLGRLTRLGLSVADNVIVPVEPQEMSTTGLDNLMNFIEGVRQTHTPSIVVGAMPPYILVAGRRRYLAAQRSGLALAAERYSSMPEAYQRQLRYMENSPEGRNNYSSAELIANITKEQEAGATIEWLARAFVRSKSTVDKYLRVGRDKVLREELRLGLPLTRALALVNDHGDKAGEVAKACLLYTSD